MRQESVDGRTTKYLFPVSDFYVETTYVNYPNKHIICFSSMVGCPIGCRFCVSGYGTPGRSLSLTSQEMIQQCEHIIHEKQLDRAYKPILFSCMGEGEPLLNYDNVVIAFNHLGIKYPDSKLALSTSGIRPSAIARLARERFPVPFKLQVSIHSVEEDVRKQLIVVTQPLSKIKQAIEEFAFSNHGLELNYVLFQGVNDSEEDGARLAEFAGNILIKLNTYNTISQSNLQRSTNVEQFATVLDRFGATYEFYETNGTDIDAACGQLTYRLRVAD